MAVADGVEEAVHGGHQRAFPHGVGVDDVDYQLVVVTKLAAVLKASAGGTAPTPVGLPGRVCWIRCSSYSANMETTLNASSEVT